MSCAGAWCPSGPKDIKVGFASINAKAEGIETKPAFREAFHQRRRLVPVDNFVNRLLSFTPDRRAILTPTCGGTGLSR
jgi:SOS response associated peptidase (SRAP)